MTSFFEEEGVVVGETVVARPEANGAAAAFSTKHKFPASLF